MAGIVPHYEECVLKKASKKAVCLAGSEKCPWCDMVLRNARALAMHQKVRMF